MWGGAAVFIALRPLLFTIPTSLSVSFPTSLSFPLSLSIYLSLSLSLSLSLYFFLSLSLSLQPPTWSDMQAASGGDFYLNDGVRYNIIIRNL
jgi:hypothetical protein